MKPKKFFNHRNRPRTTGSFLIKKLTSKPKKAKSTTGGTMEIRRVKSVLEEMIGREVCCTEIGGNERIRRIHVTSELLSAEHVGGGVFVLYFYMCKLFYDIRSEGSGEFYIRRTRRALLAVSTQCVKSACFDAEEVSMKLSCADSRYELFVTTRPARRATLEASSDPAGTEELHRSVQYARETDTLPDFRGRYVPEEVYCALTH